MPDNKHYIFSRHQTQIAALEYEKENLLKLQNASQSDADVQKLLTLQRHKTQLEQRVKL